MKTHGPAGIGGGWHVADGKKTTLPAVGAALQGRRRGGSRHVQRPGSSSACQGLSEKRFKQLTAQSRNKSSTLARSRLACASTAVCGLCNKACAPSWQWAWAHMAAKNWRVWWGVCWDVWIMACSKSNPLGDQPLSLAAVSVPIAGSGWPAPAQMWRLAK